MGTSAEFLSPSAAAKLLAISVKALRLYEQHGLITPVRTTAGWRAYGPAEMARAGEIVSLRALGLSLAQVARVLGGEPDGLAAALMVHQADLETRIRKLTDTVAKVRHLRSELNDGKAPTFEELARLVRPSSEAGVAFMLPWPWGGEEFKLSDIRPLNYIIGPLGSGKTRLAYAIAENLPDASFIGLERLDGGSANVQSRMDSNPTLSQGVERALTWLVEDGAEVSPALMALMVALASERSTTLVVDMIEEGLNKATQEALISYLRNRGSEAPSLFVLTRSSAILDLDAVGSDEAVILCPANHSPPTWVAPYPGAPGYEAVATCLASPEVRARTAGVVAIRSKVS